MNRGFGDSGFSRRNLDAIKQWYQFYSSPTRRVRSQVNHIYASIMAFVKLEAIKMKQRLNHYALKSKLYLAGMKTMINELNQLKYGNQLTFEF